MNRIESVELIRLIAIFAVIAIHITLFFLNENPHPDKDGIETAK